MDTSNNFLMFPVIWRPTNCHRSQMSLRKVHFLVKIHQRGVMVVYPSISKCQWNKCNQGIYGFISLKKRKEQRTLPLGIIPKDFIESLLVSVNRGQKSKQFSVKIVCKKEEYIFIYQMYSPPDFLKRPPENHDLFSAKWRQTNECANGKLLCVDQRRKRSKGKVKLRCHSEISTVYRVWSTILRHECVIPSDVPAQGLMWEGMEASVKWTRCTSECLTCSSEPHKHSKCEKRKMPWKIKGAKLQW